MTKWYAVQRRSGDQWDNGSHDYDEAYEILKAQGCGLIAVVDEDTHTCIEEIDFDDVVTRFQFEADGDCNILWAENCDCHYLIRAEVKVPEGASEDYGYMAMKNAIVEAMPEDELKTVSFWYDGQEDLLEADAKDGEVTIDCSGRAEKWFH